MEIRNFRVAHLLPLGYGYLNAAEASDSGSLFYPAFFLVTFAPILNNFLTVPVGKLFI